MKITSVGCTAYTGTMEHPDEFWEDRVLRPVDIYPPFGTQNTPPITHVGQRSHRMRSNFVHIMADNGVTGMGGPITDEQAVHITRRLAPLLRRGDAGWEHHRRPGQHHQ